MARRCPGDRRPARPPAAATPASPRGRSRSRPAKASTKRSRRRPATPACASNGSSLVGYSLPTARAATSRAVSDNQQPPRLLHVAPDLGPQLGLRIETPLRPDAVGELDDQLLA